MVVNRLDSEVDDVIEPAADEQHTPFGLIGLAFVLVMSAAAVVLMVVAFSAPAPEADAANIFVACPTSSAPTKTVGPNPTAGPSKTPFPSTTPCKVTQTPVQTPTITPTKQPEPGDTDLDGCSDQAENSSDKNSGGLRNYLSFWDFYDVWTHPPGDPIGWERNGVINLFDILAVAGRFGPGVAPSKAESLALALTPPTSDSDYHADYDRSQPVGPGPYDLGPPDGTISIPHDILQAAAQFGHDCS